MNFHKTLFPLLGLLFLLFNIFFATLPGDFDSALYSSDELELMTLDVTLQLLAKQADYDPILLYEDENIILHYISFDRDDYHKDGALKLFLTNKTNLPLSIVAEKITINGHPVENEMFDSRTPSRATHILSQSIAFTNIWIYTLTLDEHAITSAETLSIEGEYFSTEFSLRERTLSPIPLQAIPSQPFHTDTILLP